MMFFKKKNVFASFKHSLDRAGVPIITLKSNNKDFNFIVDSGASTSVLNKSDLNDFDIVEMHSDKTLVYGLDSSVGFHAENCTVKLSDENLTFDVTFSVVDLRNTFLDLYEESGIYACGLLGSDFLKDNKYILDFDKMIAYHND